MTYKKSKIVSFSEKVKEKEAQKHKLEQLLKRFDELNMQTTSIEVDYFEMHVLINSILLFFNSVNELYSQSKELGALTNDEVEEYRHDLKILTNLLKNIYTEFINSDFINKSSFTVNLKELEYIELVLNEQIDLQATFDKSTSEYIYNFDYNEQDRYSKAEVYLYKLINDCRKNLSNKIQTDNNIDDTFYDNCDNFNNNLLLQDQINITKNKIKAYEDVLDKISDMYIREYHSKISFIHENTLTTNNIPLYDVYFMKPNREVTSLESSKENYYFALYSHEDVLKLTAQDSTQSSFFRFKEGWRLFTKLESPNNLNELLNENIQVSETRQLLKEYFSNNNTNIKDMDIEVIGKTELLSLIKKFNNLQDNITDTIEDILDIYNDNHKLIKDTSIKKDLSSLLKQTRKF